MFTNTEYAGLSRTRGGSYYSRLSKKGVVLQKCYLFRHPGPRSGISRLYQRLGIPHLVRDDALFGQPQFFLPTFTIELSSKSQISCLISLI